MKVMRLNRTILAAALLIIGCNKVDVPVQTVEDGAMHFNVSHPATKASETSFEMGDKIGVYVTAYENGVALPLELGGNFKNNIPVTFDGTEWTATPTIYWDENISQYDVFAYYPFSHPESVDEMPFSVALDQRVPKSANALSAYEASDFLYARNRGVTAADGDVDLLFKHNMSKFSVNLIKGDDYEGDIPEDLTIYIHSTVTDCLIDLSTGDVVKDPYAPTNTVIAKRIDNDTYSAIIVPQMITNKKPLVEIIFKDVSYMVESKFQFKSGTHHILNIKMNSNPDKVKIEIGGEIENGWE